MTRAEQIIAEASHAADGMVDGNKYPFLYGWLKTEIRRLCEEIETLEERCAKMEAK